MNGICCGFAAWPTLGRTSTRGSDPVWIKSVSAVARITEGLQGSDVSVLKTLSNSMESGEQLSAPSPAASSVHTTAFSPPTRSSAPSAKSPLVPGQTSLGSSLSPCGHLFRQAGDQPFNMSAVSSAFPVVSHPGFGLYASSSGRTEFGGLGTLGVSAALAAHPQLGTFPEWWRNSEARGQGPASFFPHLLGLPPFLSSPVQNHESDSFLSRSHAKNGQGSPKGVSGAVNGSSVTASPRRGSSIAVSLPPGNPDLPKVAKSRARSRKNNQDKPEQKSKEKNPSKNPATGSSSNSDSESSSNPSSDTASSSDSDDLEDDDDEDDDEDEEEDPSNESEDSDSDNEAPGKRKEKGGGDSRKDLRDPRDERCSRDQSSRTETAPHTYHPAQPPLQPVPLRFPGSTAHEEAKPHQSVIQATGLASGAKPLSLVSRPHGDPSASPMPVPLCPSPKPVPFPRSLSDSPKPLSLALSPPSKPKSLTPSPKPAALSPDRGTPSCRSVPDHPVQQVNDFRLKQTLPSQVLPLRLKKLQGVHKTQKKVGSSMSKLLPEAHKLPSPQNNHSRLFLSSPLLRHPQPNGVIQSSAQDAPLALITKPRGQARAPDKPLPSAPAAALSPMPVNLSAGAKSHSAQPSTSPAQAHGLGQTWVPKATRAGKGLSQSHLAQSLVDLFRGTESDVPSGKDSDDSVEDENDEDDDDDDDDDDEEEDEDDSDDSPSVSDSNLESDSGGSEEEVKDHAGTETDTEGEKTPLKLTKSTSVLDTTASRSANCSPLNLVKTASLALPSPLNSANTLTYHSAPSSSYSFNVQPAPGKRRRVTDERELRAPLELGWQREARIRNQSGRMQGDVAYCAPSGKKLRQYQDVVKTEPIAVAKCADGGARSVSQGLQWSLLKEEEILPRILALDGRRGRPSSAEDQEPVDNSSPLSRRKKGRSPNVGEAELSSAANAKLLRKLKAQEIARQAAQLKLMRRLETQALARAAKEARKQLAIRAAEEKRKQKEQIKILKQQEKMKRLQQIRMEKERRAQQILEAKRKRKEEAANAKILEAEKRTKEKEIRRQQAVIFKHQELERHRLDMERERRRQHLMLIKALEARKKAEEKERLKQEKRDEKRLHKERKLEQRRLEVEIAREMKKPNEDMCLEDHKPLPVLSRVEGLLLPDGVFSDCLMVLQFLRSFGKVLGFDVSADVPNLGVLQEGLLNVGESAGAVQDLLVRMLSVAVCDPGLPPGHRTKTALGDHLTNVGINRDNVSEILQIYMEAHCGLTELAELVESLRTKAFQAHTPTQKASVLAFLVNELACSKSVISEIDKNIDHMTNLRRDKWVVEGSLRKLRIIHGKKTGKRDAAAVGGEEAQALGTPSAGRKRKRKAGDSDEDDDEDSDDQGDEDEEEEEEGKKGKKVDVCEDEDEGDQSASVEELERGIEKLSKQQSQIRRKLFESSHMLRSMAYGLDRYKRRYWVLPQCGGVFVEGMENSEGPEEAEKERERGRIAKMVQVKEEPGEVPEKYPGVGLDPNLEGNVATPESVQEKESCNLFLQKPGSFSKLSQLLEVAKMSAETEPYLQKPNGNSELTVPTGKSSPVPADPRTSSLPGSPLVAPAHSGTGAPLDPPPPDPNPGKACSPQPLLPGDQLLRVLTEKSGHWFSLLPRSPCDDSSLTSAPTPPAASPQPSSAQPKSPSSPAHLATSTSSSPYNSMGINNFALSALQVKSGVHILGLPFCGWPAGMMSPNLSFSGGALPPLMGVGYPQTDGNGNPFLAPGISTSKSESPGPPSEKPPSAASPAAEVAKPPDSPAPQPIPEELLSGWWKVADMEELRSLVKALHSRGLRERTLQKQIQKHLECIIQACSRNRDATSIDAAELEENQVTEEMVQRWCVEEQAMEVDIGILQQVEELERKVASASLQVKGWIYPEPQSEREDLVYHEHKRVTKPCPAGDKAAGPRQEDTGDSSIVRRVNNPLDIAVTRLAELERNIERREEEEVAPGMKTWRKALAEVRSAAQLGLCIQQLQKSIAWERSIMKVYCQICRKGDNEELLLLCDGCDKGCHTYCHRPKITAIPDGDWFCPACISKASGQSPKNKKQQSRAGGLDEGSGGGATGGGGGCSGSLGGNGKRSTDPKRSKKPSSGGEAVEDDAGSTSSSPKKGGKEVKRKKGEETPPPNQPPRDNEKDLTLCSILLSELEGHEDAWPFLSPVNLKSVPGYKKVIKKPMDFSTIREKLCCNQYQNLETFIIDVNLVFDNCEKFNEDNSDIGRAGHRNAQYKLSKHLSLRVQLARYRNGVTNLHDRGPQR
ncbi:hypothetical protein GJAV_G00203920 [Gymnothorax javanicus]|nr:hypothetical protein GJAV_G00203920 [Gymnothorax javanicus]